MRIGRAAAAALLLAFVGCAPAPPPDPPNVVLVLIDTLRADHLGLYGYERPTSPTIDALGKASWVFDRHVASAAQTVPSTLSMMLSLDPAEHGFFHDGNRRFDQYRPHYPADFTFLAEVFSKAGYATAAFVGNPFLTKSSGFGQGFDLLLYSSRRGETLTGPALEWLEQTPRHAPFFLYLHYFDVHWPYDPPEPYRSRFRPEQPGRPFYVTGPAPDVRPEDLAASIALYDGAIAYVDDQIGRLLDGLSRLGRREHTIVVVTADHGDEFLDHGGMGHGTTVYGELVRVPLVISAPWILGAPRRIATLSRHVDLAPTLLDFAGVARPAEFRGKTLLEPAPVAFTEDGPWRGVYANGRKLVVNTKTKARQQFGLEDVRDQTPLGGDPDPALVDQLAGYERVRDAHKASAQGESGPTWSPEELERLRALGYAR